MYERSKRNKDGEKDLFRQMIVVSIKDSISDCSDIYSEKNKSDAIKWFNNKNINSDFTFNKVSEYVFGDLVDADKLRRRVLTMINNNDNISGIKNIIKLFEED